MIPAPVLLQITKQLPPSASRLYCWDVGGLLIEPLRLLRPDTDMSAVSVLAEHWPQAEVDAIIGWDVALTRGLLRAALGRLRPGGRLVLANPFQRFDTAHGDTLTQCGYVRLLLEPLESGAGMLLRGERPHTEADTLARVQVAAAQDADALTLEAYRGRFVHFLIQQMPNVPAWKRSSSDVVEWHALASAGRFLTFSSLPKAVAFLQVGVLSGRVRDVNKVAKFRREAVVGWPLLLNPVLGDLPAERLEQVRVDPSLAEAPDE